MRLSPLRSILLIAVMTIALATLAYTTTCNIDSMNVRDKNVSYSNCIFDSSLVNFDYLPNSSSVSVSVTMKNSVVKVGGAAFRRTDTLAASQARVNLSLFDTTVIDGLLGFSGAFTNLNVLVSRTVARMSNSMCLFFFNAFSPTDNCFLLFEDTTVMWPAGSSGGDVFQKAGATFFGLSANSALHIFRTNATNAGSIWYVKGLGPVMGYVVNYAGTITIDYTTCTNCTKAFLAADPGVSPFAGSQGSSLRVSNATITGGGVFWTSSNAEPFGFGVNATVVLSGIVTDGPLFPATGEAYIKGKTSLTFAHINAKSIGLQPPRMFPSYMYLGKLECNTFMGNITFNGIKLPTGSILAYQNAQLDPTVVIDDYSFATTNVTAGADTYAIGDPTPAFCGWKQYLFASEETLGTGKSSWKRAECVCKSGYAMPYCSRREDPLHYYAGYIYVPVECQVQNCRVCDKDDAAVCEVCGGGFEKVGSGCRATKSSSGLSTGAIVGIVVGVVGGVLVIVLVVVLVVCCCRKKPAAIEAVEDVAAVQQSPSRTYDNASISPPTTPPAEYGCNPLSNPTEKDESASSFRLSARRARRASGTDSTAGEAQVQFILPEGKNSVW